MPEFAPFSGTESPDQLAVWVAFARDLAHTSGKLIMRHYRTPYTIETKADDTPVTIADRQAESHMRDLIMARFPDHGILGEEFGAHQPGATYQWVLDPIDGTKSFVCGTYLFGTLVALLREGRPIVGVIHHPVTNDMLIGTGREAWLNGQPVRVRPCTRLADAVLLTTSHWNVHAHQNGAAFDALAQQVKLYRSWGDCHGYFLLATGGADIMTDPIMAPWDLMALIPVVEGAGGRITDWHGGDPITGPGVVATAGPLHSAVLHALNPR